MTPEPIERTELDDERNLCPRHSVTGRAGYMLGTARDLRELAAPAVTSAFRRDGMVGLSVVDFSGTGAIPAVLPWRSVMDQVVGPLERRAQRVVGTPTVGVGPGVEGVSQEKAGRMMPITRTYATKAMTARTSILRKREFLNADSDIVRSSCNSSVWCGLSTLPPIQGVSSQSRSRLVRITS